MSVVIGRRPEAAREVFQLVPGLLNVTVDNFPASDSFQNLAHRAVLTNTDKIVVWTPSSGYKMHLVMFVVSPPDSGAVTVFDRTAPAKDDPIFTVLFNEKKSVPFGLGTDLDFGKDHILVAQWIADAGNPTAYFTAVGHEHLVP